LKPTRIYSSFKSFFTTNAANKSATYARSMFKEIMRILRFKKSLRRTLLASRQPTF